ncbi:MAG: pilus assembly protein PilP [Polyangiaceae bacterium]|nr:pilus assembly protein PilP [Myxococcales bacterium]MCB9589778.1 pilus assembly protein PilP [Polyangiaceae bacterium]
MAPRIAPSQCPRASRALWVLGLAAFGLAGVACEEKVMQSTTQAAPVDSLASASAGPGEDAGPPKVEFQEADFSETERSRDPFRSFAGMFAEESKTTVRSQREVMLDQFSIDELKLIGLVTRINPAKAMLVDPTGKGHVVQRGQFIGRAERVQAGTSGAEYEINWRVDRIREEDIVLVREDPTHPDVPSATRVIPLRPENIQTSN